MDGDGPVAVVGCGVCCDGADAGVVTVVVGDGGGKSIVVVDGDCDDGDSSIVFEVFGDGDSGGDSSSDVDGCRNGWRY